MREVIHIGVFNGCLGFPERIDVVLLCFDFFESVWLESRGIPLIVRGVLLVQMKI